MSSRSNLPNAATTRLTSEWSDSAAVRKRISQFKWRINDGNIETSGWCTMG